MAHNDFGYQAFVNSIPQLAAYGLAEEDLIDIKIECIMFNKDAAWIFDTDKVLAVIDAWMLESDNTWQPPWLDFSNLILFNNMFQPY